MKILGDGLRARRLSLNLSQEVAATRSGISVSTLKNLETGRGTSAWALVSLCRTYNCDGWVLSLAPEETLAQQLGEIETHPRQRATKRREVRRV